jgi:hypothetical protein
MVDSKLLATIPEIQLTQDVNTERVHLGIVTSYVEGPSKHYGNRNVLPNIVSRC